MHCKRIRPRRVGVALITAALGLSAACAPAPKNEAHGNRETVEAVAPVPSAGQRIWHELEYYGFIHFGMNTFTDREWGEGSEDPKLFQPTALDCRQWARVAREAGMRGLILTAKHHDGFCLWPSAYTKHSVASSPWRGGKGDVVRDLSQACAEFGLRFGVYLSPWDRNCKLYGDSPAYNEYYKKQLTELLTGYGSIFEVWFDGACAEGPNGKKQVYDWPGFVQTVRALQPQAVIFSDAGPDVRWVGNESGLGDPTNWSMLHRERFAPGVADEKQLATGHEDGPHWVPAECDVSIRPGWFYHPAEDGKVKSTEDLMRIWHASVGRNANLLLNLPVDRRGLVHENDVARLLEFRAAREACLRTNVALGAAIRATAERPGYDAALATDGDAHTFWAAPRGARAAELEVTLPALRRIHRIELREPIELGQRVKRFEVDLWKEGAWVTVASGTTIGRRRILEPGVLEGSRFRVRILDAREAPLLAEIALYAPTP